jgi:hypothetical protein
LRFLRALRDSWHDLARFSGLVGAATQALFALATTKFPSGGVPLSAVARSFTRFGEAVGL